MDNRGFGLGYKELPEKVPPSNPERRELLEAPRRWMSFFNTALRDYLLDEEQPDRDWFVGQLDEYYAWTQQSVEPLIKRALELDDPNSPGDIVSEFTFHQLNGPMTYLWHELVYTGKVMPYTPEEIGNMQTHLAVAMAPAARRYKRLNENSSPSTQKQLRRLTGTLTEVDSLITLDELSKLERRLIVLPAPSMFESNPTTSGRNVDQLLFDTLNKKVQGIQVKTRVVDTKTVKHYDRHFATVIDGAHDLGNSTYSPTNRDHQRSLPGQISMSFLAERPLNAVPRSVSRPDFMRSRAIAQELSRGRRSFLGQATTHMADRVITELYADEAIEAASDEQIA